MSARLIAEIGADTSGFEAGLNRADAAASRFANKVSGKLNAAFGAGFLIGTIAQMPRMFVEQAQKISEGAAKLKVTTDEYQMLSAAAKDAGMGVEEFISSNAKQGKMLDTLIGQLQAYRSQIGMTTDAVRQWKEMGEAGKGFGSGVSGALGWLLRKGYNLGAVGLNLGGAMLNSMGFGNLTGVPAEDHLLEASKNAYRAFGLPLGPQDEGSRALPMSGRGNQKRFDDLKESMRMLQLQEQQLSKGQSQRGSIWNPGLTDWQQGGAFIGRSGMVITDNRDIVNKLEEVRQEMRANTEEQRKLREGTP